MDTLILVQYVPYAPHFKSCLQFRQCSNRQSLLQSITDECSKLGFSLKTTYFIIIMIKTPLLDPRPRRSLLAKLLWYYWGSHAANGCKFSVWVELNRFQQAVKIPPFILSVHPTSLACQSEMKTSNENGNHVECGMMSSLVINNAIFRFDLTCHNRLRRKTRICPKNYPPGFLSTCLWNKWPKMRHRP